MASKFLWHILLETLFIKDVWYKTNGYTRQVPYLIRVLSLVDQNCMYYFPNHFDDYSRRARPFSFRNRDDFLCAFFKILKCCRKKNNQAYFLENRFVELKNEKKKQHKTNQQHDKKIFFNMI